MVKLIFITLCLDSKHNCRIGAMLLAFVLPFLFTMSLIRVSFADTEEFSAIITVCPEGPPICDFATIQGGIDASDAGETVLVGNGIYTENLSLRTTIRIESIDGPEFTVVTALEGPVITGTAVSSVYLRGLGISGLETIFTTTGIELQDSEVTMSDMLISDFSGDPANEFSPDGKDAFGVRSTGSISLTVLNSRFQNLVASGGLSDGDAGYKGGDAAGVWVNGEGQVRVISTTVDNLTGGAAGSVNYGIGCGGSGGSATGIHVEGGADLTVTGSEIMNLRGGSPCHGYPGCTGEAGIFVGIDSQGGQVFLNNNLVTDLVLVPSHGGGPSYGIRSTNSDGTYLDGNTIQGTSGSRETVKGWRSDQIRSPWCSEPGADVTAIASEGDLLLQMTSNTITGLHSGGTGGRSTGLFVRNASAMSVTHNIIENLSGGYGGLAAVGAYIADSNAVEIGANSITHLSGANGPQYVYYLSSGFNGGSSQGIFLVNVSSVTVFNNKIASISGGDGGQSGFSGGGRRGGDAIAITAYDSKMKIVNNTMVYAQAGAGGQWNPPGSPGTAAGVLAGSGAELTTFNNILMNLGVGILSSNSASLTSDYNDLWANDLNYVDVVPGPHDLHIHPDWYQSFHLGPDSPLIDAGTNQGTPHEDYDRDPRPVDGDGDNIAVADIGADEFCLGICLTNKSADPHIVSAGDTITYTISIENSQIAPYEGTLSLNDDLSPLTQYVEGSLSASSGIATYGNGTISWTGTILAGGSVAITFQVSTDPAVEGPYIVINEADLTDDSGRSWQMRSLVWVDPLPNYLPLVSATR